MPLPNSPPVFAHRACRQTGRGHPERLLDIFGIPWFFMVGQWDNMGNSALLWACEISVKTQNSIKNHHLSTFVFGMFLKGHPHGRAMGAHGIWDFMGRDVWCARNAQRGTSYLGELLCWASAYRIGQPIALQ
jgi:hypothetical protein